MNRKDLYFVGMAIAVVALFTVLSIVRHKAPAMTARSEHAGLNQKTPADTCWSCHTPDSKIWERHPNKGKPNDRDKKTPCSACHKLPEPQLGAASFHTSNKREVEFIWRNLQQK